MCAQLCTDAQDVEVNRGHGGKDTYFHVEGHLSRRQVEMRKFGNLFWDYRVYVFHQFALVSIGLQQELLVKLIL